MSIAPNDVVRPINRLLKIAVVGGVEMAVRLHIERGDELNSRDDMGSTPLMLAAARNRAGICRLLIDAGADMLALDPAGNDALAIAKAAGAIDAASVIESAQAIRRAQNVRCERIEEPDRVVDKVSEPVVVLPETRDCAGASDASLSGRDPSAEEQEMHDGASHCGGSLLSPPAPTAGLPTPATHTGFPTIETEDEASTFDVSGWETEDLLPPPTGDATLAAAPVAIHQVISLHAPIDDSADWSDFEAFLPEQATPMPRAEDAESAAELRALLLRALREGSVPEIALEDVCVGGEDSAGATSTSPLRYVISDLGAETDERFEYRAPHESFEVHVEPVETLDEEEAVNEALAFLDDLEARRNDPMRLYMRDAQRRNLITAEDEIALAKEMENAVMQALDALAAWPTGMQRLLKAVGSARSGERPLNSVTTGARDEAEPDHGAPAEMDPVISAPLVDEESGAAVESGESDDAPEGELDAPMEALAEGFFEKAQGLCPSTDLACAQQADVSGTRATLASLSLKRTFLMELAEVAVGDESKEATRFAAAIRTLATARDRMAGANLRLVLSLAKRYLYSGLPMDDLIQEGNIGLLKAVDKFDWRRGYKFSTMATWWIRQQVSRSAADDARTIRLPVHIHEKLYRVEREAEAMSKANGREPSNAELSARLNMPERKVETLLQSGAAPLSMDEMDAEGNRPFDLIEDESVADPFEAIAAKELRATLVSMLSKLGNRPGQVMRMRFGLGDAAADPSTLEEVGLQFDVTRERIRQIEAKALRRLAHRNNRNLLRGWVSDEDPERKDADSDEASVAPRAPAPVARPSDDRGDGQGLSALDRLLTMATKLGISVDDDRSGPVRSTWVYLIKPRDGADRAMVSKLVAAGFEFWPGKGYWR